MRNLISTERCKIRFWDTSARIVETYSCVDVKVPRSETKKAAAMSSQSNSFSSFRYPSEASILSWRVVNGNMEGGVEVQQACCRGRAAEGVVPCLRTAQAWNECVAKRLELMSAVENGRNRIKAVS